jgi:hypothetical protein
MNNLHPPTRAAAAETAKGAFVSANSSLLRVFHLFLFASRRARALGANAHAHAQKIRDSRVTPRSPPLRHERTEPEPEPKPNRSSSIDGAVRLWDTRSSTCQAVSHGHVRGVLDLAPSPDFKSVVTASDDHTARVFRMVP